MPLLFYQITKVSKLNCGLSPFNLINAQKKKPVTGWPPIWGGRKNPILLGLVWKNHQPPTRPCAHEWQKNKEGKMQSTEFSVLTRSYQGTNLLPV